MPVIIVRSFSGMAFHCSCISLVVSLLASSILPAWVSPICLTATLPHG